MFGSLVSDAFAVLGFLAFLAVTSAAALVILALNKGSVVKAVKDFKEKGEP